MMASYAPDLGEMAMMVQKWVGKATITKQRAKGRALIRMYLMYYSNHFKVGKLMATVLLCLELQVDGMRRR